MTAADRLSVVLPVAGGLLALALALGLVRRSGDKRRALPPLNREGMLETLARFMDGTVPDMLLENARAVGKVFRLNMPELRRWVVVCDAKLARSILENHPEKPDLYKNFESAIYGVSTMFTKRTHGEGWEVVRKHLAKAFSMTVLSSTLPQFDTKIRRLVSIFEDAAKAGRSVDVVSVMQRFTLDFLTSSMFDLDMDAMGDGVTEGTEFLHDMEVALQEYCLKQVFNPFRKYMFWNTEIRQAESSSQRIRSVAEKILSEYRMKRSPEEIATDPSILGHIARGPYSSDAERYAEMITFLVAGHDTTGMTMAWILIEMARHPQAWEKVHAEILANIGDGVFPIPYSGIISRLPYLDMVVKEAMRLWPVAALGAIREAAVDISIGDMVIPKGSTVMLPFYAITRDGIEVFVSHTRKQPLH